MLATLASATVVRAVTLSSALARPRMYQQLRMTSGFVGPRQQQIEERLAEVFAPTYMEVINESHGVKEDESHFKARPTAIPNSCWLLRHYSPP